MRKFSAIALLSLLMFVYSSCNDQTAVKSDQPPKIIKSSSATVPEWILKKKKTEDTVYFVGMSSKTQDLKEAKRLSINDATAQLVEFIGFRATSKLQSVKEMSDQDNIGTFKQNIIQSIEGKGTANVTVDVEDIYYEQYSDNTYSMYTLIKFPLSWVEKERERLKKLVADQRAKSSGYNKEANSSILKGELAKALDLSLQAYSVSELAAENSDINQEARNNIILILSSLSFSLDNSPKYAYREGSSDTVRVKVSSTKTGNVVPGLMTSSFEINSNAVVSAISGNNTWADGLVTYEVLKTLETTGPIELTISFAMSKFDAIQKTDPEFYTEILRLHKSQSLKVPLTLVRKDQALPMGIVIIDFIHETKDSLKVGASPKFLESVSGLMANNGYNVTPSEIPTTVLKNSKEEGQIRDAVLSVFKKKYPDIKRLLAGIRQINKLGELGKDIKFSSYDLGESGLMAVDVKCVLSLIDVDNAKVIKSFALDVKGQGLNLEQAIELASKRSLEKLETEINK